MPLVWSFRTPSLNWICPTVPEIGRLQFSIDCQLKVPIFTFLGLKGSNFKFHLSNPQKELPWPERHIMAHCAWRCVQRCDLWAWRRNEKKDRNFDTSNWLFVQTTHVDVAPWNFACGSCPGSSYIFQVSWKSVERSPSCGRSKIALSHWLGPWLIQQLVLLYKPW